MQKLFQQVENNTHINDELNLLTKRIAYYPWAILHFCRAKEIEQLLDALTNEIKARTDTHLENTTSSPIQEVGGIDLRKIRYRVVFSES